MKGKATERSLAFRRTSKRREKENEENTKVRKMMGFRAEQKTAQRFNGGSRSSTCSITRSEIRKRKNRLVGARTFRSPSPSIVRVLSARYGSS